MLVAAMTPMPTNPRSVFLAALVGSATGCLEEEPPAPDVSNLKVEMRWEANDKRMLEISIANPDIPCTEVEEEFLGEEAVRCTSAPWTLSVDGKDVVTNPVICYSAHDTLFGHVNKRCEGGRALVQVVETGAEDIELVAQGDGEENRVVIEGVRRTYPFVQQTAFDRGSPGTAVVDELELSSDVYTAVYSRASVEALRDSAFASDGNVLRMSPYSLAGGTYDVRVLAKASHPRGTIAVVVEGTLAVAP
jgi:hypothetical protein